jgi:prepilin-type processing-associated H-X9-DG protein
MQAKKRHQEQKVESRLRKIRNRRSYGVLAMPSLLSESQFNNAMNVVSFVDGHVSFMKIYWKPSSAPAFIPACAYDPPAGYDYQWSGN